MCGILGYVGNNQVVQVILDGLANFKYRGYHSAGLAVLRVTVSLRLLKQNAD